MDEKTLNERLDAINKQSEQLFANLNALNGAKNEVLFWLSELKKAQAADATVNQDIDPA